MRRISILVNAENPQGDAVADFLSRAFQNQRLRDKVSNDSTLESFDSRAVSASDIGGNDVLLMIIDQASPTAPTRSRGFYTILPSEDVFLRYLINDVIDRPQGSSDNMANPDGVSTGLDILGGKNGIDPDTFRKVLLAALGLAAAWQFGPALIGLAGSLLGRQSSEKTQTS